MRDLYTVLEQIKAVVPTDHEFYERVNSHLESVAYMAPELSKLRYVLFSEVLWDSFGSNCSGFTDWQCDVIRIWTGNSELTNEDIRKDNEPS